MKQVIRDRMGLTGLIMSDDIGMKALKGSPGDITRAVTEGGCDVVLHCSGKFLEMVEVGNAAPALTGAPRERFDAARCHLHAPEPFDPVDAMALVGEAARTRVAAVGADPTVQV